MKPNGEPILRRRARSIPVAAICGLLVALALGPAAAQSDGAGAPRSAQDVKQVHILTWRGCEQVCNAFQTFLVSRGLQVEFTVLSAERDRANLPQMVADTKAARPDLVVTWGTTVTLATVGRYDETDSSRFITDIPVVYLYVGDPVRAGIVQDDQTSGRPNVAGANILVPFDTQIRIMQSYRDIERLGVVYGADEPNSVAAVEGLRTAVERAGLTLVEQTLALGDDGRPLPESIAPAIAALAAEEPDFLVLVSSSFLVVNVQDFTAAAVEAGLPVFTSAEVPIVEADAMLGLYASLRSIGQVSGYQAERVLRDGAPPDTLPTQSLSRFTLVVNMQVAQSLELYPPMLLLQFAELM